MDIGAGLGALLLFGTALAIASVAAIPQARHAARLRKRLAALKDAMIADANEAARMREESNALRDDLEKAAAVLRRVGPALTEAVCALPRDAHAALASAGPQGLTALAALAPAGPDGLSAFAQIGDEFLARKHALDEMRGIWLDESSSESACHSLLMRNLWVLEPDYFEASKVMADVSIKRMLEEIFEDVKKATVPGLSDKIEPDIFGLFDPLHSFHAYHEKNQGGKTLLIMELKAPKHWIDAKDMGQAFKYAHAVLQKLNPPESFLQVDCFVVGGDVGPGVDRIVMQWNDKVPRSVTVIPLTWADLIQRAERMLLLPVTPQPELAAPPPEAPAAEIPDVASTEVASAESADAETAEPEDFGEEEPLLLETARAPAEA